ncbi:ABC transporter ATP-binding protein [Marinitenerispora sediminis]|uniref:ABC transporter ATP-binding protein n=1 Tax=Marinitenerispora sediminis TaxID=1931232 RepID=UPI000DF23954|nr:ABC transporter ATP-binding protein [Marinitenerispora sediminis]
MTSRVPLPTATAAQTRRALARLLRPHRALAAATLAVLVAGATVQMAGPLLLGYVVDVIADGRPASALVLPAVLLLAVAAGHAALSALGTVLTSRLGETALARLRERVMDRALRLPMSRVEQAGSGDVVARVAGDVAVIATAVREALPAFAGAGLTVGFTLIGLGALDWRFAAAMLCAVPIQAFALHRYLRTSGPLYAEQRIAEGERAQQLLDSVGGAATVRAFGLSDRHTGLVAARSRTAVDFALRVVGLRNRFFARLNVAEFTGLAAILVAGFLLVRADAVTIGAVAAAALFFIRLFDPINVLLFLFDQVQEAGAGLARLVGIADLEPPRDPAEAPVPAGASVRVAGVRHAYTPGHDVLRGIDLEIAAGTRVALVGASGAGKTTLAKLIAGVHQPTAGTVAIGGVPLESLGAAGTRERVALVTQEVHVFAGTLADDLRLARPEAGDAELRAALDLAGALEWAQALPQGLATAVGDGGHRLTATQAQQLALARLALADPEVAVLDEATAEAGSAGARVLEAAADRVLAGRTAVVVVHRLTQAATADTVVVLDAGRIVESGPHAALVAAGGRYADLWAAWSTANLPGQR